MLTAHDPDADFQALARFAIPDTVIAVVFDTSAAVVIPHDYDEQIVALVADLLEGRGYVRELDPGANPPEAVVLCCATASQAARFTYDWWSHWGWWPGWGASRGWGPGWGYSPPPGISAASYDRGTLVIDMLDVRDPDPVIRKVPSVWTAVIGGPLLGTPAQVPSRIDQGIRRAFDQSSYLRRNQGKPES